jgi:diacylglycerol kinase family enzyme
VRCPPFQNIHVVANPMSGPDETPLDAIARHLSSCDTPTTIHEVNDDAGPTELARRAVQSGADVVIAVGGDGTVLGVAEALLGTDVALGLLPQGSANVMAKELGIPEDLDAALRLVTGPTGCFRQTDAALVGPSADDGAPFLLRVQVGIGAAMTAWVEPEDKERWGRWAYVKTMLAHRRTFDGVRYRLILDGEARTVRGVGLVLANAGNFGVPGLRFHEDIEVDDGQLHAVVLHNLSWGTIARIAFGALWSWITRQEFEPPPTMTVIPFREARVELDDEQPVQRDGEEYEGGFPLVARVLPGALRIVVPAEAPYPSDDPEDLALASSASSASGASPESE